MNPFQISWKSLLYNKWTFVLNVLLVAFGTGILTLLLIGTTQIGDKLRGNAKGIDLVVGAKGSPLQVILSSIYFIDFPTGNIAMSEAQQLAKNPMVKRAVPLALGDNYFGCRIVGTDSSFINLYHLKIANGKFWEKDFEVVIGSEMAKNRNLKVGDTFHGSHGLTAGEEGAHEGRPYVITGILAPAGNTTDNLILTNISTIWNIHGIDSEGQNDKREITSLLIQYKSRMAMIILPMIVNKTTSMQAASPAKESARLFSLIGVGVETMQWFALSLMFIAGISVFVSLYNSLKERMYDLAIMRVMGASQFRIFLIIMIEGLILTSIGSIAGIIIGHFTLELIGHFQESSQARLTGFYFVTEEFYLLTGGFLIGILASALPAFKAYSTDISKTLSKG
ncbi:FtsX-like permease family protein [Dyadobacter sp. CY356]|uniref:ABC transporter permease n=1 Tax=Dyadobacter sp. CY356 TaxID=2906442 RepID=UPI001F3B0193|nr:FtsX-like permease family protein [Dyadobacter sp. CY356]MCF0056239.1 ABC transporter permease [Dyadobacter sp. CY356]